ncbi:Angiotensin-converting enzyme [Blattella germanica]|nr:Angiotensin-converting enzyme [Blattella germanica]
MARKLLLLMATALVFIGASGFDPEQEMQKMPDEEARAKEYLEYLDREYSKWATKQTVAEWNYASNITDENLQEKLAISAEAAKFSKQEWQETIKYPWTTYKDPDVRRQFMKQSVLGTAALDADKHQKLEELVSEMSSIYSKAKICDYKNPSKCDLSLEPDFTNNAEFWLRDYEAPDFKEQVSKLWEKIEPLYLQIHAYVRRKLRETYGEELVKPRGPIPAQLLGNMWSQKWGNILNITIPYPGRPRVDVTNAMVQQGYTPLKMFKLSEQFFTSLNLSAMPEMFWEKSILQKPSDRELVCHASAWDFYDGKDFRIKQCTRVTMDHLFTAHHEMGHIQYFLQYKDQPLIYKEGANPGFHEAVGDVMALSVSTPKHLRKIGLLEESDKGEDYEATINYLFLQGLQKIVFLPSAYLMDLWRWNVFSGDITSDSYNCEWWKLRYFVSFVIQFQFHRTLCEKAGEYVPNDPSKPLHECDIYQSTEAGNLLGKMLQMGSSKPWPDAMEVLTGQREMDASGLLDYFKPLSEWLEKENKKTGEYIGWEPTERRCVQTKDELEQGKTDEKKKEE